MLRTVLLLTLTSAVFALFSCGGSSTRPAATPTPTAAATPTPPVTPTPTPASTPVFTSTASPAASEAQEYSYDMVATDPDGGSVTFALTSGPSGASISGSTLTWTPDHLQSRKPNAFRITATTSEGGTGTQSFNIVPKGNIQGTVNTQRFSRDGLQTTAPDLSQSTIAAYVPDGNGGFTQIAGTGYSDGTFTIPGVPAGYFMISHGNYVHFWTSDSDVAEISNLIGRADAVSGGTNLSFSMTLSSALQQGDRFEWYSADALTDELGGLISASGSGSSLWTSGPSMISMSGPNHYIDTTKQDEVFLTHLERATAGSGVVHTIAESYSPAPFTEVSGQTAVISGSMSAVPANSTVRLKVNGSQFAAMDSQLQPASTTKSSMFRVLGQPYGAPATAASSIWTGVQWPMLADYVPASAIVTDSDGGELAYGYPFPSTEYSPVLFYRYQLQGPAVSYPPPPPGGPTGGIQTLTHSCGAYYRRGLFQGWGFTIWDSAICYWGNSAATLNGEVGVFTSPTDSEQGISPVIGPVGTITVDGQAFSNGSVNASLAPTISWTPPTVGTPDQYVVTLQTLSASQSTISVGNVILGVNTDDQISCCDTYITNSTSLTLPAGVLQSGTYTLLSIEADSFHGETSGTPALPMGYALTVPGLILPPAN